MDSVVFARAVPVVVLCLVPLACGDAGSGVVPPPEEAVYETEHFQIRDQSDQDDAVITALSARLESEFERVGQALPGQTAPERITVRILRGDGIPFVTVGENTLTQWAETLALDYLPHQLTHLYTGYPRRAFLEEGLAVFVTEMLLPDATTVNPYRGQSPHAWVSLFENFGSTISLFTAYRAENLTYAASGSSADASAWQLFVEAGSFTRWVVEAYGWDAWWRLYDVDNLGVALGSDVSELESAWLAAARALHPDPLPCETALGVVGAREAFWCNRARGQ